MLLLGNNVLILVDACGVPVLIDILQQYMNNTEFTALTCNILNKGVFHSIHRFIIYFVVVCKSQIDYSDISVAALNILKHYQDNKNSDLVLLQALSLLSGMSDLVIGMPK